MDKPKRGWLGLRSREVEAGIAAAQSGQLTDNHTLMANAASMTSAAAEAQRQYQAAQMGMVYGGGASALSSMAKNLSPSKYAEFTLRILECDGGFVVHLNDARRVIKSLDELNEIAIGYMATRALEKD